MRAHNTPSTLYTLITLDCVSALHMFCCRKHLASLLVIDKLSRVTDTIISRYPPLPCCSLCLVSPQQSDSWVCDAARFITPDMCTTVSSIYHRVTARLTALMPGTHVTCHDSSLLARHNTRLSCATPGYLLHQLTIKISTVTRLFEVFAPPKGVPSLSPMRPSHYTPPINPCSAARGWMSPVQYSGRAPTPFSGDKTR